MAGLAIVVESGANVAVIELHGGDSLENVYSSSRINYYGITGYPTYKFDGVLEIVGGYAGWENDAYPLIEQRNGILSDFTLDIQFEETDGDYNATVTVDNVGGNTSSNLVLHFAITESKLPITWGGVDEQHDALRLMVPDQNGTALDFSGGDIQEVELSFNTSYWDTDNCTMIAFVQDTQTKEIKQGTKEFMAIPLYDIDVQAKAVKHPVGLYCGGSVQPVVTIKNMGAENLVSCDIEYSINGGSAQTYSWTGELGFNLGEDVVLEEMSFNSQAVNTLEFSVSNPNGEADPNPENNTFSHEFEAAPQIATSTVNFELMTDQYPEETTWELKNSAGTVLYSGGPYNGQASTVFNETWDLEELDCYDFYIYDAYGDGICCAYGNGYYKLMDENNEIFAEGGEFGSEDTRPFEYFDANALTADFMADVTSIIEGESVSFTDLSSGSITIWSWEFEGGTPATSTDQNPVVTYDVEGVYDVSLTISDGSNANTVVKEDYIEVDHITGISTIDNSGVQVFPNPTTGKVYINGVEDATVKVYNTAGTVVATYNTFNDQVIDLSNMNNGIYFIQITMDNETISKKVNLIK